MAYDSIAGKEEVLLKGVVVDVEAEEMEEEVVDSSSQPLKQTIV